MVCLIVGLLPGGVIRYRHSITVVFCRFLGIPQPSLEKGGLRITANCGLLRGRDLARVFSVRIEARRIER